MFSFSTSLCLVSTLPGFPKSPLFLHLFLLAQGFWISVPTSLLLSVLNMFCFCFPFCLYSFPSLFCCYVCSPLSWFSWMVILPLSGVLCSVMPALINTDSAQPHSLGLIVRLLSPQDSLSFSAHPVVSGLTRDLSCLLHFEKRFSHFVLGFFHACWYLNPNPLIPQ